MHFPCVDQAGADSGEGRADPGERDVVADPGDEAANDDGGEGVLHKSANLSR